MDKFHNKSGDVSIYGFLCGYKQVKGRVSLFQDGDFQVQVDDEDGRRIVWESFDALGEGRAYFKKMVSLHEGIQRKQNYGHRTN